MLLLRRLLAAGIHPDHVFLEMVPALLAFDHEITSLLCDKAIIWEDLPAPEPYWHSPFERRWWLRNSLLPCRAHCDALLARLLPWRGRRRRLPLLALAHRRRRLLPHGPGGPRLPRRISETPDACPRRILLVAPGLPHQSGGRPRRGEFLALCRSHRIGVTLVLMPEGNDYRAWYACTAQACLGKYLDGLCQDCGVRLVDARTWVADKDFADGHHLLCGGVSAFTRRFGREVYRPVVNQEVRASTRVSLARRGHEALDDQGGVTAVRTARTRVAISVAHGAVRPPRPSPPVARQAQNRPLASGKNISRKPFNFICASSRPSGAAPPSAVRRRVVRFEFQLCRRQRQQGLSQPPELLPVEAAMKGNLAKTKPDGQQLIGPGEPVQEQGQRAVPQIALICGQVETSSSGRSRSSAP